jgi:hypothetical protein
MYRTIQEIMDDNETWFSPATMAFFDSRIEDDIYPVADGAYFVTSEEPPYGERAWSVRFAKDGGSDIHTVGTFCGHETYQNARIAARKAFNAHRANWTPPTYVPGNRPFLPPVA